MNLIKKLWNGELPLSTAYWIYGVLGGGVIKLISEGGLHVISIQYLTTFTYSLLLLAVPYQVLVSVGVWRSSNTYKGNQVWAAGAKVWAVLSWIMLMGVLVNTFDTKINNVYELQQAVEITNKTLPSQIDKETRLDKVDIENNSYNLHATLVNYTNSKELVDLIDLKLKDNIVKTTCTDEQTKSILNKGILVTYIYSDKSGVEITRIVVDKSKCKT